MTPLPNPEADPRWLSVLARDKAADGGFFTCVKTTGVYCRPSCSARTPLRKNVRFVATTAEAQAQGFRACKKCKPDQASPDAARNAAVSAACATIEAAETAPSLAALAAGAGLSPHHFHRLFKAATGVTPGAYAMAVRARRVRDALPESGSVTEAIYDAGFNSSGRFYAKANAMLGMAPAQYRKGGEAAEIRFAVGECSLGSVLTAQSEKGVCAIMLGEDPDALVRALQDRFPRATLVGGDKAFEAITARVVALVEAPGAGLDLPLDVRGTAFQERVWRALQAIPPGSTATYADIASAIGEPKAVRAVAMACGANPVAVAIPCHRVVRTDGGLSGYHWGVDRKRYLLAREGVTSFG